MTPQEEDHLPGLSVERVRVVEQGHAYNKEGIKVCQIDQNVRFSIEGLRSYCFANWDERIYDAFVLAAAVQFCDHVKPRSKVAWGRAFEVKIPVHDPDLWNSPSVSNTLHDALTVLTGDHWSIEFINRKTPADQPRQSSLDLPSGAVTLMPFSDGLDSRAVSGLIENNNSSGLMRVRLGSKRLGGKQNSKHEPFALVPYRVSYKPYGSRESSGRSRGFRFALLSAIGAFMADASEIVVSESGQGAIGPTLVTVGQGYDDYRNHPLFTIRMEAFIKALFGHSVKYQFPRIWHTKGETLKFYLDTCGEKAPWRDTWSCWQPNQFSSVDGAKRQCGICAACLLRRLSVHAAGQKEDTATYVWEDLSATSFEEGAAKNFKLRHPRGAHFQYAIAGVLHLEHLAKFASSPLNRSALARQNSQLSKALNIPLDDITSKSKRMLQAHQDEWESFLTSLGNDSFIVKWLAGGQS